jgi:hypothetical protein
MSNCLEKPTKVIQNKEITHRINVGHSLAPLTGIKRYIKFEEINLKILIFEIDCAMKVSHRIWSAVVFRPDTF